MRQVIHAIDGATATTSSNAINIEDAKKVSLQFIRTNHSSGKTVFSVTVSIDGTTYAAANMIAAAGAVANTETIARVASYDTGTANANAVYSLDLTHLAAQYIIVTATETTDGTHNAWVYIEY